MSNGGLGEVHGCLDMTMEVTNTICNGGKERVALFGRDDVVTEVVVQGSSRVILKHQPQLHIVHCYRKERT